MFSKSSSVAKFMGCCSCFGFARKRNPLSRPSSGFNNCLSQEFLLDEDMEDDDDDDRSYDGDVTSTGRGDESDAGSPGRESQTRPKRSEEILELREQMGLVCRQFPVKETHQLVRTEVKSFFCASQFVVWIVVVVVLFKSLLFSLQVESVILNVVRSVVVLFFFLELVLKV